MHQRLENNLALPRVPHETLNVTLHPQRFEFDSTEDEIIGDLHGNFRMHYGYFEEMQESRKMARIDPASTCSTDGDTVIAVKRTCLEVEVSN